jgi:small subunit ribosomal protein S8
MSDSLSNFFSHIKSAQKGRVLVIEHFKSQVTLAILATLQESGYIRGYRVFGGRSATTSSNSSTSSQKIEILLKYKNQKPAINQILRVSKPSRRFYLSVNQLTGLFTDKGRQTNEARPKSAPCLMQGILILSTSKGVMSHLTAYRLNVGGEVLCHVF